MEVSAKYLSKFIFDVCFNLQHLSSFTLKSFQSLWSVIVTSDAGAVNGSVTQILIKMYF